MTYCSDVLRDECWSASGAAFGATGSCTPSLLPLIRGWSTTGNPTPVLVSFAAYAEIPTLALGAARGLACCDTPGPGRAGALVGAPACRQSVHAGSIDLQLESALFRVLPAGSVDAGRRWDALRRQGMGYGTVGAVWYACVAVRCLPNLLSHYQDGSRHDFRQAAAVLVTNARDREPNPP